MPRKPHPRKFRILRRSDGRFECRNEHSMDSPLGVDRSLTMALGTAMREAAATSRDKRCRVVIEVEQSDGKFKLEHVVEPPT
jgi:hypothetical protein